MLFRHGQLIEGAGWMEILNLQKISSIGLLPVVYVNSIKRTTYCIQVTLSTLYIKLNEVTALEKLNNACPYDWLHPKSAENEMRFFWKMMFDFQVNCLMVARSEPEGKFRLHILALHKLIKWYFIFDKFNYSR